MSTMGGADESGAVGRRSNGRALTGDDARPANGPASHTAVDAPTNPAAPTSARAFRGDIQGLRAIAVVLVVAYHAGIPGIGGGYLGVDIFFVISGFLISGHLIESLESKGRINFGDFYARRARRILPASLTIVVATVVGAFLLYPPLGLKQVLSDAVATALYVPNMVFATQGVDYLADPTPSLFQHYWSLGVEEQFYLFWPLLLWLIWRLVRRGRWRMVVIASIVAASLAAGIIVTFTSQPWAFFSLPTRAWELGAGTVMALALRSHRLRIANPIVAAVTGWVGLALLAATVVLYTPDTLWPGWAAVVPVVAVSLVIYAGVDAAPYGPTRLLATRPMMFIGLISYSIYLVHWPLLTLLPDKFGPLPEWAMIGLGVASFPLAYLLYRYVETPGRKAHALTTRRPRVSLVAALVGSVVVACGSVGAQAAVQSIPLNTGQVEADSAASAPPDFTNTIGTNTKPQLRDAEGDVPKLYGEGCQPTGNHKRSDRCTFGDTDADKTMVLFGDSHAAQWFPAVNTYAKQHGYTLESRTRAACPAADESVMHQGRPYRACDSARQRQLDELNADPPEVIVLASMSHYSFADPSDQAYADRWYDAWRSTLDQLPSESEVIVIADTPVSKEDNPARCLSAHLKDTEACDTDRSTALVGSGREAESRAALASGAAYVRMNDLLCTSEECGAVVSNRVVYRDHHHLTSSFVSKAAPIFDRRFGQALEAESSRD